MAKTYLITGGNGFIGKNLSIFLKKKEPKCRTIKLPKKINLINSKRTNYFFKKINFKANRIIPKLKKKGIYIVEELDFPDTRSDMNLKNDKNTLYSILNSIKKIGILKSTKKYFYES